jgi:hypothetical protein
MLAIERELGKVVRRVPDKSSCPFWLLIIKFDKLILKVYICSANETPQTLGWIWLTGLPGMPVPDLFGQRGLV